MTFMIKMKENRKTFTHELRIKSSKLISGFYYKTLNEKDSAEGYLYGGAATILLTQNTILKIMPHISNTHKILVLK